jgi:hypothetical protein
MAYLKLLSWSGDADNIHETLEERQSADSIQKIIGIDL